MDGRWRTFGYGDNGLIPFPGIPFLAETQGPIVQPMACLAC